MQPSRVVANSSTYDVAITYGTGVICSRAWVRMYIARHLYSIVEAIVGSGPVVVVAAL